MLALRSTAELVTALRCNRDRGELSLERAPLGVIVDQLERALVGIAGLSRATEAYQQLAPARVEVVEVLELQPAEDLQGASGPSASAIAMARLRRRRV